MTLLVTAAACSTAPPTQTDPLPAPTPAPVAEPAPPSEAIARADALLEDFRRREAAQAKFDRENPPPTFIPIPRSLRPVNQTPAASSESETPAPDAPVTQPAPAAPATAAPARDATWWREEMKSLQSVLDQASAHLAEAEKANFKYGYNDAQAEYKKRAAAVANARQAIERLRDEARRAGVPPGWLR